MGIELVVGTGELEEVTVVIFGIFGVNDKGSEGLEGVIVDTVRFIPSVSIVNTFVSLQSLCFDLTGIFITMGSLEKYGFPSLVEL